MSRVLLYWVKFSTLMRSVLADCDSFKIHGSLLCLCHIYLFIKLCMCFHVPLSCIYDCLYELLFESWPHLFACLGMTRITSCLWLLSFIEGKGIHYNVDFLGRLWYPFIIHYVKFDIYLLGDHVDGWGVSLGSIILAPSFSTFVGVVTNYSMQRCWRSWCMQMLWYLVSVLFIPLNCISLNTSSIW